jgi:hypothetical protein
LELYFKLKKNKFDSLDKMILNNNFLLNEQKWVLLNIFSKYQKTLFSLSKFLVIYKWKKAKYYDNSQDLIGTSYNDLKSNQLLTIIQNNTKYIFRASDILNIWKNSLLNNLILNPFPKKPKNPYNNIVFKNHNLYNLYFQIRFNTILKIPNLIEKFLKYDFSLELFKHIEYNNLFNNSIKCYVKSIKEDKSLLFFECEYMFQKENIFKKKDITIEKINEKMIDELKIIIRNYIYSVYFIHPIQRKHYKKLFYKYSKIFINKYKLHFRRIVKIKTRN